MPRIHRRALLGAAGALGLPGLLRAQEGWRPSGTLRVVVPAAPGGTTDIMGRLLAAHLQSRWGVNAVTENRSGGGGTIGTLEVVRARPDGQSILLGNIGPQAIAYSLFNNLQYRPEDLLPISNMIRGPNVLVVHPSVPAQSVPELVRHLKDRAGRLSYGTPGVGQSPHLSAVWFHQLTGTQGTAVHYRGAAPAMVALVGGEIQFMFDNLTTAVEQVRAGTVRALAVTSAERSPQLPDLPALRETMPELAQYDVSTWFGAFHPAGVPEGALRAVNGEMRVLLEQPATQRRFAEMGGVADYGTPERFAAFVRDETAKWREVIQREGLRLEVG
ncbi:MAG TPA: tripartite tricarboxylate transporter substrate binding protein [Acetobacteraceae bacterium]|nr:tripartite tricarboxylate transporter substrate binding protein [Acetobacteraceae bacterium]